MILNIDNIMITMTEDDLKNALEYAINKKIINGDEIGYHTVERLDFSVDDGYVVAITLTREVGDEDA